MQTAIDLTHPLTSEIPTWDGTCGYCLEMTKDYDKQFRVQQINMQAGVGTHMDAPSHCIPGGMSIAEIPFEQLMVPACVIDVRAKAHPDYEVSREDIEDFEKIHGPIPENALVIAYTGWSRFWSDPILYRNEDPMGQLHYPAFSKEAVEFLLTKEIAGIAIDTLSPDCADTTFPVHQLILGAGKYIIENVADCSELPPQGCRVLALPLRLEEGTESPIRMIALLPKNKEVDPCLTGY